MVVKKKKKEDAKFVCHALFLLLPHLHPRNNQRGNERFSSDVIYSFSTNSKQGKYFITNTQVSLEDPERSINGLLFFEQCTDHFLYVTYHETPMEGTCDVIFPIKLFMQFSLGILLAMEGGWQRLNTIKPLFQINQDFKKSPSLSWDQTLVFSCSDIIQNEI